MSKIILSIIVGLVSVTFLSLVDAEDLKCDYNYLRTDDTSIFFDEYVNRAADDYYGWSLSGDDNACKSDVILEVRNDPLSPNEYHEKYGKIKAVWSMNSTEGQWKLIKMKGLFTHWF